MKTYLYRASNLPSIFCTQFQGGSQFLMMAKKTAASCNLFIKECSTQVCLLGGHTVDIHIFYTYYNI